MGKPSRKLWTSSPNRIHKIRLKRYKKHNFKTTKLKSGTMPRSGVLSSYKPKPPIDKEQLLLAWDRGRGLDWSSRGMPPWKGIFTCSFSINKVFILNSQSTLANTNSHPGLAAIKGFLHSPHREKSLVLSWLLIIHYLHGLDQVIQLLDQFLFLPSSKKYKISIWLDSGDKQMRIQ